MPRRRGEDDFDGEEDDDYEEEEDLDDEDEDVRGGRGGGGGKKRRRSDFIDDIAEEDDEEEEEDYDDEDYGGGGGSKKQKKKSSGSQFFELEAYEDDSGGEEDEDEPEDDFIDHTDAELHGEGGGRRIPRPLLSREDDAEEIEALERRIQQRYAKSNHAEYDEETTDVEQQALLPSVKDPKLWMVKCAIGREREAAVCLMQKCIDKGSEMQIRSAIALDHLKNYIYIEADKESHVREACKGLRNMYAQKVMLVSIKEMTDVLSVESKAIDLAEDTWVRMKIGTYKNDLAKVVNVDNVRQRVTVKLIPRIDLQAVANKSEGREVVKKKGFNPPPRFMNIEEAREMGILVERRRDPDTNDYFWKMEGMMFKEGFLYKTVSLKSIYSQNIRPTFDELEKFRKPGDGDGDVASLANLFRDRKKGHFLKGDAVIVIKGDLKNLMGWVEKVEEDNVHIRPKMKDLPKTLAVNQKELCKYFKPGDHVKIVQGAQEGATGMVVKVEGPILILVSDTTKEDIRVFADYVVESSEVTSGVTRIGDYELHDLVLLDDTNFGVIIRVESEAFQVLKGVPDRPEVALVKLREIKSKIDKRNIIAQDRSKNTINVKDVVRILEGPCKGKQGPVEHIYRGMLFINDRHHLEHAGYICAKSQACMVIGGSRVNGDRNGGALSRYPQRAAPRVPPSSRNTRGGRPPIDSGGRHNHRGGRGHDSLVGTTIKIRLGPFKGYRGRVVDVTGPSVRIELDSQMRVVTVTRDQISDNITVTTTNRETPRYGMGSETPMHPSRTPLHPYMTPMRDPGATPIHDGMRTPMRDRAWNPYAPMSPARDNWEDGNPGSWGTSPQYQPGTPPARSYEAPTPGTGWANTNSGSYSEAGTPRDNSPAYVNAPSPYLPSTPGQPMTPGSASYLPGTPGGQPMTPGGGGLDLMSPAIGGDGDGPWFMPDILVNVRKPGEDSITGVVRDVLPDGSCKVSLGSGGNGEIVTALPHELEMVVPRKSDKIKIMSGAQRGSTGKLIGIDGTDGIVKVDDTLDVKILDMVILAKLAHS
ncbi:hypothetical protein MKW94_004064 [Papaver nudicaule]|uniref:Transcription elongation factor SPT5 n=1 Tax=Papaver nudicaule TaxID=74823 RepID=A0AA41SFX5_PAPNU|nr:hypothetical protein [Papaver nudicaule]